MSQCKNVETGVVFCQPIVQRPHVARDLFGDRRTRKESVIRTTATKCSNQARSSNSWVKMWMQHCLLLGLLKRAGSRAFFSAPCQVYPRWRRMPPIQLGQKWTLHQGFGPDVDREQDQDPLQNRPIGKQRRLGRSVRSGGSASHQPHGLPKWPNPARRLRVAQKVKGKAQRGVRVRAQRQCKRPRTSWMYRRPRPLQIENHSVQLVLHTMSLLAWSTACGVTNSKRVSISLATRAISMLLMTPGQPVKVRKHHCTLLEVCYVWLRITWSRLAWRAMQAEWQRCGNFPRWETHLLGTSGSVTGGE